MKQAKRITLHKATGNKVTSDEVSVVIEESIEEDVTSMKIESTAKQSKATETVIETTPAVEQEITVDTPNKDMTLPTAEVFTVEQLQKKTIPQLKEILRVYKLPVTGTKPILLERLNKYCQK